MSSTVCIDSPLGKWAYDLRVNLSAAAAVVANADGSTTTDPRVSCVKSATGTYVFTLPGNFYVATGLMAQLNAATPTSKWATVTAHSLGGGTPEAGGGSTTTVTVKTLDDNATPTDSDVAAAATLDCRFSFIKNKI